MAEHNQQFDSFTEWCNKASSWLTRHPSFHPKDFRAICFDTKGRLCRCGADFVRARDGDAFPVKWLWPDQVASLSAQQSEPVVRKLDWIERDGVAGTFDASTSIGHYIATITDEGRGMWFIVGQTGANFMAADIDAVRAAAQADYEQRIMAAIEIAPQSDRRPSPGQKQVSETGKELPKNTEQPMNNADVSVGELAGFFVTEFPHLLTMLTQIEVARALLARYKIERLDRLASSGRR